ncbi:GNAT family N-acetyltransferase [Novosphingobium pokkalii]|uniref:GNAT family N-acetyltransferase n=1 Tax=Novosphingobium pokkalii TaxID=1770194 RepID=UPI0036398D58
MALANLHGMANPKGTIRRRGMMNTEGLDPHLLHAWLAARSLARGLPMPVPEHGGFRVDTGSEMETVRWVFPRMGDGLKELARTIHQPRQFLKVCETSEALCPALPAHWTIPASSHVMRANGPMPRRQLADGYSIAVEQSGPVTSVRIVTDTGILAASGYGAETDGVFVYDRIVTEPEHRRKGLGHVLMQTLHEARRDPHSFELLVATDDGRALYETLGWEKIASYASASIVVM